MKWLIGLAGSLFIRALHRTLRVRHVRVHHIEQFPQAIVAFWHCHLLLMLHSRYKRPIQVMISRSKDGELIARVFDWYGVTSARGSATRGGSAAMREMIRTARAGASIAITPDGPKGPPRLAKDGVVYAAKATGLPIVPVAFAAKKKSCSDPGTAWSSRTPSPAPCSSTASRSSCRVTPRSRSGGGGWSAHSTRSRMKSNHSSKISGRSSDDRGTMSDERYAGSSIIVHRSSF